jgi:hypothetical protein
MAEGDRAEPRGKPRAVPAEASSTEGRQGGGDGPVTCSECGAAVGRAQLAGHLRQKHRIYQVGGVRRSLNETLAVLLAGLCSPRPLAGAWTQLAEIIREEQGPRADAFLAAAVGQALARLPDKQRGEALTAVADAVAADPESPRLIPLLAADTSSTEGRQGGDAPRHLAIALANLLLPPLERDVLLGLRSLLLDRRLAPDMQTAATAILLRSTGREGPAAVDVLRAFVNGLGKARSIDKLQQLETTLGPCPALTELCAELEDQLRMTCPRCNIELRRREMIPHLWEQHRLVLDGRRVREPWGMIDEWIDEYRRTRDRDLLDRCKAVAHELDGDNGLRRVQRLLLAAGIPDPDALQALLAEAASNRSSLCPHCFALVPAPLPAPVRPLNRWHGRLSARGYRVEVTEGGILSRIEIETPATAGAQRQETEKHLTRQGAMMLVSAPFVLFALVVAFGLLDAGTAPLWPVLIILAVAGGLAAAVRSRWPEPRPAVERAVDHAWTRLVPRLHPDAFSLADSEFVAGLALSSTGKGRPHLREAPLRQMLTLMEKAVSAGKGAVEHLAALRRLAVNDVAGHHDPVLLVAEQIGRCFEGKLSLAFAEQLLDEWQSEWWSRGNLLRLHILLCDRAFEAGFEVRNLVEAGQVAPTLGAVLQTENADGLARLRLLWSLRASRPWDRCGEDARLGFEFAEDPDSADVLQRWPDLLLYQPTTNPRAEFVVCGRGVVFEGNLFREKPKSIQAIARRLHGGTGHELVIDGEVFRFRTDAEWLGWRLEEWFAVWQKQFAHEKVEGVHDWRSPAVTANLLARETVPCPECRRPVLTRAGQVGGLLDERRA